MRSASASTNHAAFVGETGLQCKYQVTDALLLRAGYEVIWLEGVALAPGQIQETYTTTSFAAHSSVQALGVNCNSGAFLSRRHRRPGIFVLRIEISDLRS